MHALTATATMLLKVEMVAMMIDNYPDYSYC